MIDESKNANLNNLKQWAEDVVCPVCYAPLHFEEATVVCSGCARIYPVVDGIPVLIPQRAVRPPI
jgi:uncharacterized protein YbaR (Trm112 family)